MGFGDRVINLGLVEREDGSVVHYPWGRFGKGRVVDEDTVARLARFSKGALVAVWILLILSITVNDWPVLVMGPLYFGIIITWNSTAFSHCELVD